MANSFDDINWYRICFFVALAMLYFFAMREFYPDAKYFFPYSIIHILALIFFYSIGKAVLWESRYKSHHVTVDGCTGSIFGKPEFVADPSMGKGFHWAIFNLGVSFFPITLRGKLATLVVPADQIFNAGKNYVGLTLVSKWDLGLLPSPVNFFLRHNVEDFNIKKIYYGKYSRAYIDNSGHEEDLNKQIDAKNSLIAVLQKTIEHDFGNFEEIKEFANRMTDQKFSLKSLFKKAVKEEEE